MGTYKGISFLKL